MAYLKTVVTYNLPAEAEVDRAYLEANGLTVCLLNANTARNELGPPFFIQLQVADAEYDRAVALLREANPSRFGSPTRVAELDRDFKRTVGLFFAGAIPSGLLALLVAPPPHYRPELLASAHRLPDVRPILALLAGGLGGVIAVAAAHRFQRRSRSGRFQ